MTVPYSIRSELLKSVSRSFYLSIKFLPEKMREPIAIGYLLARATDTVADSGDMTMETRISTLERMNRYDKEIDFSNFISQIEHSGEKELLTRFPEILKWCHSLNQANAEAVKTVLTTITEGQRWDLEHFVGDMTTTSADELMDYTYQVAGCVGEFWTRVGFINLGDKFANPRDRGTMMEDGKKLGQGLQLVNILRDLHEDLPNNRHYLPDEDLLHWLQVCRDHLEAGKRYVKKVRNKRARFATALPLYLAEATAEKLETAGVEIIKNKKIKITRSTVYKMAAKAALLT